MDGLTIGELGYYLDVFELVSEAVRAMWVKDLAAHNEEQEHG